MKKYLLVFIGVIFLCSCYHKSIQNGEADDVIKADIYNFKDGKYLITQEVLFQVTSKRTGGGFSTTSGYNELRITTYDLNSGVKVARKGTGKEIKHPIKMLGFTEGNIWFYSKDDGFHSRDPKTLEIKISHDKFLAINPYFKDNFAKCEWYQINQFFSFSILSNKILISDNQGYRYLVDPTTLNAEKQPENFKFPNEFRNEPFNNYSKFYKLSLDFKGDLRKQIFLDSKPLTFELTFLDGKFIIDNNLPRLFVKINEKYLSCKESYDKLEKEFNEFKEINGTDAWKLENNLRMKFRNIEDSLRNLKYKKDDIDRTWNSIAIDNNLPSDHTLLMPDSISFFVFHKSNTANDANAIISKVQIKNQKEIKEVWKLVLTDLFYDYSAARETNSFKKVFSKGDPQFDYMFMDIIENKLVIIYMLHALCVDINTGKLLWKFRI